MLTGLAVFAATHCFLPVLRDLVQTGFAATAVTVLDGVVRRLVDLVLAAVFIDAVVFFTEAVFLVVLVLVAAVFAALAGFFFAAVLTEVVCLVAFLVFTTCFCTADGRACSDACVNGVKVNDVKNRAQSVSETLFIRATERSPGLC